MLAMFLLGFVMDAFEIIFVVVPIVAPALLKLPGVEASTGSLGQGLSIAVGLALAARLNEKKHKIFCIMGDGEGRKARCGKPQWKRDTTNSTI